MRALGLRTVSLLALAPKENPTEGLAALQWAKALGAKSERKRDYIGALLAFYSGDQKTTFGQCAQDYLKATEAIAGDDVREEARQDGDGRRAACHAPANSSAL